MTQTTISLDTLQAEPEAAVLAAVARVEAYINTYSQHKNLDQEEITRVYTVAEECPLLLDDLRALVAAARASGALTGIVQVDNTPTVVNLDFDSSAARGLVDVVEALSDANAPLCHPDGKLMVNTEQIAWLGQRAALCDVQRNALTAVMTEIAGNAQRPPNMNLHMPAGVAQQVRDAIAAGDALGDVRCGTKGLVAAYGLGKPADAK